MLLIGLVVAGTVTYVNRPKREVPLVFSKDRMLAELWNTYKRNYLEASSGRTLDKQRDNLTTSEGQGYTMLRAVWQDDKDTFAKSWAFTHNNLKRPDDHLSAWMFGRHADGSYGVLTEKGGNNTASDGDTDTALALVFAANRWQQADYLDRAKEMINDVWSQEVVTVAGKPVLTANNLEKDSKKSVVVNPSYFSPYAYRIFAGLDKQHDWTGLAANSYNILNQSVHAPLDTSRSANLVPDWVFIDRQTGAITPSGKPELSTNYGYDALRSPWRVALDEQWFHSPEAKHTLQQFKFLSDAWNANHSLKAVYAHDGKVVGNYESPAMYGGSIGYFMVTDKPAADALYTEKLRTLYDPNKQSWKQDLSYYDDNWAWFGLALHDGALPNLAKGAKS